MGNEVRDFYEKHHVHPRRQNFTHFLDKVSCCNRGHGPLQPQIQLIAEQFSIQKRLLSPLDLDDVIITTTEKSGGGGVCASLHSITPFII